MNLEYVKNLFPEVAITWEDVIESVAHNFKVGTTKQIYSETHAPTIVLHDQIFPKTIETMVGEVRRRTGAQTMHTYVSFGAGAPTFGNHKDTMDVLLVQAIGTTGYIINEGETYWLEPGDALCIPEGVWHNPQVIGPRATLSFDFLVYPQPSELH
jgi:ribosomal protein L16 Arg81 hydroxylase